MPAYNFKDETGNRHGRLVVLAFVGKKERALQWLCRCDCGNEVVALARNLRNGNTSSCGCLRREMAKVKNLIHGKASTPEHKAWTSMLERGQSMTKHNAHRYAARGITVCDEWRDSFEAFFVHVGLRPTSKHSIDRIDNDKGYEPGNVRWATKSEQAYNRSTTRYVTIRGERMPAKQAVQRFSSCTYVTVIKRLLKGWSDEDAVLLPNQPSINFLKHQSRPDEARVRRRRVSTND